MKWLASIVLDGLRWSLDQFSWGLLEAYGYEADASDGMKADSDCDKRTPEEREADIICLMCHGHF